MCVVPIVKSTGPASCDPRGVALIAYFDRDQVSNNSEEWTRSQRPTFHSVTCLYRESSSANDVKLVSENVKDFMLLHYYMYVRHIYILMNMVSICLSKEVFV